MPTSTRRPRLGRVRKNVELDQDKLTRLKSFLGAATETETLNRAMDLVLLQQRVARGLERLAAAGGIDEVFPDGALARMRSTPKA